MKYSSYQEDAVKRTRSHKLRLVLIALFFMVILSVIIWRLYVLFIMDRQFLLNQGDARSLRTIDVPAYRGMIIDRQGAPLAVSTPVKSIWLNPKTFEANDQQFKSLAHLVGMSVPQLRHLIKTAQGREFVYLKRQVTPSLVRKVTKLGITGVSFKEEFRRYYPEGESVAQLIGFTNIDDTGIEGLELAFDDWLVGVPGQKRVIKDRLGRVIDEIGSTKEPRPGNLLQLSIDKRIQYVAYHELQKTLDEYGANSGSAVVLDIQSGEILAVVNAPSFNPNVRGRYEVERYRNKAFTDLFEPGSVVKPLSVASALESGLYTPDTAIDTRPSWMMLNGHLIRDIRDYGVLDVTSVLQHSSNIGVTKMVLSSPAEQLLNLYKQSGYGLRTASGYPGESPGLLVNPDEAKTPFVLATLAFGYGVSVTAVQLAQSYLPLANQGKFLPVSLLRHTKQVAETPIYSEKTAKAVLKMMEEVVQPTGTGRRARIPGYRVAGKTGTARIAGSNGYEASRHVASFVGIAPASHPRLVVAIVVQEPKRGSYYGGVVAAPLFAKIMGSALRIMDIPPDNIKGA